MQLAVNPLVDCVFKALLGSEDNKPLLIHFLNAVLKLQEKEQITDVDILNPYNEREFEDDKLSIVDIKALDQSGVRYQVEIQLNIGRSLANRIVYTWAEVFGQQLLEGQQYSRLKPAVSIWILANNLVSEEDSSAYHHCFLFYDPRHKVALSDCAAIHTLELNKWQKLDIKSDLDVWSWFFLNAENLDPDNPPTFLQSAMMRRAMDTLKHFKDERERTRYKARLDSWRAVSSLQQDLADEKAENIAYAQAVKDEAQAARDEVQAARDEVQSARDEVQSARDEVQSAKDEVQSAKDEVQSARDEVQAAKDEALTARKEKGRVEFEASRRERLLLDKLEEAGVDLSEL